MLSGYNSLNPVTFLYEHDSDLLINQNEFATQQGLSLNLVNALSGLQDETILNYSNMFLTNKMSVNDIMYVLPAASKVALTFPTYLAFNAYPNVTNNTLYVSISTNPNSTNTSINPLTLTPSLSDTINSNFIFYDLDGIHCRISTINGNYTKNLTLQLAGLSCYFTYETNIIGNEGLDRFEYSLDQNGNLLLFYRNYLDPTFYFKLVPNNGILSAVNVASSPVVQSDIIKTSYRGSQKLNFKNDFIYYDKSLVKDFIVNDSVTVNDVPQNHLLYYNYQSQYNFLTGSTAVIDFFKTKNVLSDDYYVNNQLPFGQNDVIQRNYTNILSKQNSELYNGALQFNYNYYTKEYSFLPDVATKFTLPETLYPYKDINIDDSNLTNSGAYGGLTPVFSDKVTKWLDINLNAVNYNEANGIYLYSWLYTDSAQLTSYWLDRYYYPKATSINIAYSGQPYQIYNYQSGLSAFLSANNISQNYMYYDIRSSLTFEPSASYYYSRIGNNYINKVVNTYGTAVTSVQIYNDFNVPQDLETSIQFSGSSYGGFMVDPTPTNSISISFDLSNKSLDSMNTNLIVGNNFDEGLSLYKGGLKNIFTPGCFISSLTGVNFFDITNSNTFNVNVSAYVGAPIKVLDVINTGFDHPVKIFYLNLNNNNPGFLEFSIYDKIFNIFEFPQVLTDMPLYGGSFGLYNLFSKQYVGNNEVQYFLKFNNYDPGQHSILAFGRVFRFDYINNLYLGYINIPANPFILGYNSVVTFNNCVSTLSGYSGKILDESVGISKLYNTVYYKDLSANTEYPSLCVFGGIFDIEVLENYMYVQTNGSVIKFDKYKTEYNTYVTNSSAVSGVKLDFINDNFEPKLLAYSSDVNGNLLVDKFDLATANLDSSYNTGLLVDPVFYNEFLYPKPATYNVLKATTFCNGNFISGGVANSYTYNTPLIDSLTAMWVDAEIGCYSLDAIPSTSLSGTVNIGNGNPVPADVTINLINNSNDTVIASMSGDGIMTSLNVTATNIVSGIPYTLQVLRTESETQLVNLGLSITNGSFVNGSIRSVGVPSRVQPIGEPSIASTLYAYNTNSLTEKYGCLGSVSTLDLSANFIYTGGVLSFNGNSFFNNKLFSGTINNVFNQYISPTSPLVVLSAYETTDQFEPFIMEFTSGTPLYTTLSGIAFQTPTNLNVINDVNKYDQGDMIARLDLYSGDNYKNKQTTIVPFDLINNDSQIVLVLDVINGYLNIYSDAELIQSVSLSANNFYTSYYLNNNFGVGVPYINNKAIPTIGENYNSYPNYYSLNNFVVYNRALNPDEVKFNYLKNQTINPINFDITQGTRNDTDTVASFNKMVIPGRKNNNIIVYVKNANLTDLSQQQLTPILLEKLRQIIPLNISDIEINYLDYNNE